MGSVIVRNLPDKVIASLKSKAKQNGRSMEAEVRDVLSAAAAKIDSERPKLGTELRKIGKVLGDLEFKTYRDPTPGEPADFS